MRLVFSTGKFGFLIATLACFAVPGHTLAYASDRAAASTAWKNGSFHVDVRGVVERSDVILQRPNTKPDQSMPLGNGRLGLAVWAANGLTAQLNRADTLPNRLSPGQVVIPGLNRLVDAADFTARLNLYDGEFTERGGGMTATVYLQPESDIVVIDVTGADPNAAQTANLYLWAPRHPEVHVQGPIAALSETWVDNKEAGASGKTFGSLAAITARGRDVRASVLNQLTVQVSYKPKPDGSFQILIASPEWAGGNAEQTAARMLGPGATLSPAEHLAWWHEFWNRTGLFKLTSSDGTAEYMENLRLIDLYTAAAERGVPIPGSQAGIGDLFSSIQDRHQWGPSDFWHWNLRMQVAANIGAGAYALNDSYFNLYRENLPHIEAWTKEHMAGRPGACVPETMRFNGPGFENETWVKGPAPLNCAVDFRPYYNARTITTGAEISLWIWNQYLATGDRAFLAANYPVMAAATRFLLAYAKRGPDGLLHTYPSNAHETQWDVHDPTTDIAAMKALFPAVVQAAQILGTDSGLVSQVKTAIPEVRDFCRMAPLANASKMSGGSVQSGHDVIAPSYDPNAPRHNSENIGLEPVWPYSLIGDTGPLHDLGVRTFVSRPNKEDDDWSFDPIQAARLGLSDQVKATMIGLTKKYQAYPSGLAAFAGPEFYVEQSGVLAAALQEALVQDYDGVIRIAPAWPSDWQADATVFVQNKGKVDVQVRHGHPVTVVFEAGFSGQVALRNPWPGHPVSIVTANQPHSRAIPENGSAPLHLQVKSGESYLIEPANQTTANLPFAPVTGSPASAPKFLGDRSIGLGRQS